MNTKICYKCKKEKELNLFGNKSRRGRIVTHSYCKECLYTDTKYRRRLFKEKCVAHKGGKCERCGYNKCLSALDFHHKDPSQKEFQIGGIRICSFDKNIEYITKELDKCILLCANCHREEHFIQEKEKMESFMTIEKRLKKTNLCSCRKQISSNAKKCKECRRKVTRPSLEELTKVFNEYEQNFSKTGRHYGVTDNSIRKWFKYLKTDLLS